VNSEIGNIVVTTPHGNVYQLAAPQGDALLIEGLTAAPHSHVKLKSSGLAIATIPHDWSMVINYRGTQSTYFRSVIV